MQVFMLPYAGGSSYSYNTFSKHSSERLTFEPVELSGRGRRHREPLMTDVNAMAADAWQQIAALRKGRYALFGHSMGALVAFQLARDVQRQALPLPSQVFLSGCNAPRIERTTRATADLPEEAFIERIKGLGGITEDVLQSRELLNFFLPILRADFRVVDSYRYEPGEKLKVPLTILAGEQEFYTPLELDLWQLETDMPVDIVTLKGNHFFIFDHVARIVSVMKNRVGAVV